jgi:hypothetical protein
LLSTRTELTRSFRPAFGRKGRQDHLGDVEHALDFRSADLLRLGDEVADGARGVRGPALGHQPLADLSHAHVEQDQQGGEHGELDHGDAAAVAAEAAERRRDLARAHAKGSLRKVSAAVITAVLPPTFESA